jgi:hypothetical protein
VRADRGEANALALVLLAPAALAVAVLVLWIGRKVDADAQVQSASAAAAQAAALQRSPALAVAAARSTVEAMLVDFTSCHGGHEVFVDTSSFGPGGEVTVTVACSPLTSDLGLAMPSSARFAARSTATVDAHRAEPLP